MKTTLRIQITMAVNFRGLRLSTRAHGSSSANRASFSDRDQASRAHSRHEDPKAPQPQEGSIEQAISNDALFPLVEEGQSFARTAAELDQIGDTRSEGIPCDPYDPNYIDPDDL
jgi:hypothetical protein